LSRRAAAPSAKRNDPSQDDMSDLSLFKRSGVSLALGNRSTRGRPLVE
jgi:hypothetical protein